MATYDWASFTTDYGLADGFVAACHGVIGRTAHHVRIIDITHQVPPQDVRRGSVVLAQTVPFLPRAIHLAVVDPGVGTQRRGIIIQAPDGTLVGPDNGLLLSAAEALGGISRAFELTNPDYRLDSVSRTFHGRDIFAPAVAHLANGVPVSALGTEIDAGDLVRLPAPELRVERGRISAEVTTVDHFGNLTLAATASDVDRAVLPRVVNVHTGQRRFTATMGTTFADVSPDELVVLVDSSEHLAIAVNSRSAAERLSVTAGDIITVEAP